MRTVSIDCEAGDVLTVVLRGELDFTNAAQVAAVVREAIDSHWPASVRVDLTEVTFLDSSGIGVLVQAMRTATELSAAFRVDSPTANVYDQLHCAGLLEVFGLPEPAQDPT